MAGEAAAARAGEHVAEGIVARAAKDVLRDAVGAGGEAGARDAERAGAGDAAIHAADRLAAHPGEEAHYTYNMVDNPGPLATDQYGQAAQNFAGGRYNAEVTTEDRVLFRGGKHDEPLGQYFSEDPPVGELQTRIDNAVERYWLDNEGRYQGTSIVDTGYAVLVPKGTTIFKGPVASRGGILVGGARDQIFIHRPWTIDGLHALDHWPLR